MNDLILITGSNGFIGTRVVESLLKNGCRNIRCFVRPSSKLGQLNEILCRYKVESQVEIFSGDLSSSVDCARAAKGVSVIYHLAASFERSVDLVLKNSAQATENLLRAFTAHGNPKRFVLVSSFAVYSNIKMKRGSLLDETSPLEVSPKQRADAYALGKLKQEEIVRDFGRTQGIPFVVVRPGTVFGPGKRELTGRIGLRVAGVFLHVGGSNQLPLTYVENCADAIVLAGINPNVDGETFNVVDDDLLTSGQFLSAYRKRVGGPVTLRLPYFVIYLLCTLCELGSRWVKRLPAKYNRQHCAAEWKGNKFSNHKLKERLNWTPRIPMKQAMDSFLAQFGSGSS